MKNTRKGIRRVFFVGFIWCGIVMVIAVTKYAIAVFDKEQHIENILCIELPRETKTEYVSIKFISNEALTSNKFPLFAVLSGDETLFDKLKLKLDKKPNHVCEDPWTIYDKINSKYPFVIEKEEVSKIIGYFSRVSGSPQYDALLILTEKNKSYLIVHDNDYFYQMLWYSIKRDYSRKS